MKDQTLEKIILTMKEVLEDSQKSINQRLLDVAGEELKEKELLGILIEVNDAAIKKFDKSTESLFPTSYNFRESYHDSIRAMNSYQPLVLLYAEKIDATKTPLKQLVSYERHMRKGYKKLGLSKKMITDIILKQRLAVLQSCGLDNIIPQ